MNRTMNFKIFQIRKLVPKPIKSTRNDAKFCRQVQNDMTELLQLSKSHSDPDITKVNYGSNFFIFQTLTFPTFAEMPKFTLRTSKSESGRAPKPKITIQSCWDYQNFIPGPFTQKSNSGQILTVQTPKTSFHLPIRF